MLLQLFIKKKYGNKKIQVWISHPSSSDRNLLFLAVFMQGRRDHSESEDFSFSRVPSLIWYNLYIHRIKWGQIQASRLQNILRKKEKNYFFQKYFGYGVFLNIIFSLDKKLQLLFSNPYIFATCWCKPWIFQTRLNLIKWKSQKKKSTKLGRYKLEILETLNL